MDKISRKKFLNEKKVGLLLRVWATKPEDVGNRVNMINEAINRARAIMIDDMSLIKRIDVLVWANKDFKDADCGLTFEALRKDFLEHRNNDKNLFLHLIKDGDPFCTILNFGIGRQNRNGCDYSVILSSEAFGYMTIPTFTAMVDAACNGALAIGVAINELTESILDGQIANTLAMWHIESLISVGLFDPRAAKASPGQIAFLVEDYSPEKKQQDGDGKVVYETAGVEETIPLIRLIRHAKRPCIAPVLPQGEGAQRYIVPDPKTQHDLWVRHWSKINTKLKRKIPQAAYVNADLNMIKGGVMPEYRQ